MMYLNTFMCFVLIMLIRIAKSKDMESFGDDTYEMANYDESHSGSEEDKLQLTVTDKPKEDNLTVATDTTLTTVTETTTTTTTTTPTTTTTKVENKTMEYETDLAEIDGRRYNNETERMYKEEMESLQNVESEEVKENYVQNTIINSDGSLEDYPYTVSIQRKGSHVSTGSLIDKSWALTAASNLYNVQESLRLYTIRLGSVDCKKGQKYPLKFLETHPSFKRGLPHYDLALVKLAYPVQFQDKIKAIPISNRNGWSQFVTTYWPTNVNSGVTWSMLDKEMLFYKRLRACNVQSIPWDTCYKLLRSDQVMLTENSRCLSNTTSSSYVCVPHVGAPLVTVDGLYGVTSGWISQNCSKNPSPSVFTVVTAPDVRSWIDHVLLHR